MENTYFLSRIVDYYAAESPGHPLHENVIYVVPNKRAGAFLKSYVQNSMKGVGRMPRFMTMRSLINIIAVRPELGVNELRFVLFDAYRKVMERRGTPEMTRDFDSFIFWGDIILSDFDEIDKYLVSASALFKNLHDLKEIQADYLTEDQKEIVRRVWGESRLTQEADRFWLHVGKDDNAPLSRKFVYLWEVMYELFEQFHTELDMMNAASPGYQFRLALESLDPVIDRARRHGLVYAFVGFNDLSTSEMLLLKRLQKEGIATFFWDMAPAERFGKQIPALSKLDKLSKEFPQPEDFEINLSANAPQIDVVSVPSNIAQAKTAGDILRSLNYLGKIDWSNAINTAIVIPDQNILMPLMFSLPEELDNINVSMGMSFRTTSFATLLHSIVLMQQRARKIRGKWHFYFEDLAAVLNHPHIRLIAGEDAQKILDYISGNKMYNIDPDELINECDNFTELLRVIRGKGTAEDATTYLLDIFGWLLDGLEKDGTELSKFEADIITRLSREVVAITTGAEIHRIEMGDRTFLYLFQRLLEKTNILTEGTPLCGLQLLGVLETRALDFENVIILSMNEGVFPRKQYTKTMIPAALRATYGLPAPDALEQTYAYCFFRLLSRAHNVSLLFDARSDKTGRSEVSRYVTQMRYLVPDVNMKFSSVNILGNAENERVLVVEKKGLVAELLDRYRTGGDRFLSATALKDYMSCPMKFYLQRVRSLKEADEVVDYMNAAEMGTLVHETIQYMFESLSDRRVTAEVLGRLIDDEATIEHAVEVCLRSLKRYSKYKSIRELPTEARIMAQELKVIVRLDLIAELNTYCSDGNSFVYRDKELKIKQGGWNITPDLSVNWWMSIDRVDYTSAGQRFIDFKTGSDELQADNFDALFKGDYKKAGIFQVLTYCQAYKDMVEDIRIQPVIHSIRGMAQYELIDPLVIGNSDITEYTPEIEAQFRPRLEELLSEIFDYSVPFVQTEDLSHCQFCACKDICGRICLKEY